MSRTAAKELYEYSLILAQALEKPEKSLDWAGTFQSMLRLCVACGHKGLFSDTMELAEKCYCRLEAVDEEILFAVRRCYCSFSKRLLGQQPQEGWEYLCRLYRRKQPGQKKCLGIFYRVWNSVRLLEAGAIGADTAVRQIKDVWEACVRLLPVCLWREDCLSTGARLLAEAGEQKLFALYEEEKRRIGVKD